jgi:hypothetical protein
MSSAADFIFTLGKRILNAILARRSPKTKRVDVEPITPDELKADAKLHDRTSKP